MSSFQESLKLSHTRLHLLLFLSYILLGTLAIFSESKLLQHSAIGLPVISSFIFLGIMQGRYLFYILLFTIPFSVSTPIIGGATISLPSEGILIILTIICIFEWLIANNFNSRFLKHPVSISIFFYFIWSLITTVTSTLPLVSIKFIFIRFCYLIVFYFFVSKLFENVKQIQIFCWLLIIPLTGVVFYTLYQHAQFNFIQEVSFSRPRPFFNDHTIYGACLAMVLPFVGASLFLPKRQRVLPRVIPFLILAILITGSLYSFSRAVWISLIASLVIFPFLWFKIPFNRILIVLIPSVAVSYFYIEPLVEDIFSHRVKHVTNFQEHFSTVTDIETNTSNLERINRWAAAWVMFKEKPLLGFGPGTYQFNYGRYQEEENLTSISTYFGDRGGVHSEYLKPLVESGIIGFLTFLAVIMATISTALRSIYTDQNRLHRMLALAFLLSLITYYIHGLVNFFLDTDKASVLFWGFTSIIVCLDLKNRKLHDQKNG